MVVWRRIVALKDLHILINARPHGFSRQCRWAAWLQLTICLPAPQVALFLWTWLIHLDTVSRYRIDELRSSDGIMHCLLRPACFICKWKELKSQKPFYASFLLHVLSLALNLFHLNMGRMEISNAIQLSSSHLSTTPQRVIREPSAPPVPSFICSTGCTLKESPV